MPPQNQQQIETALRTVGIHHGMWARSATLQRAAAGAAGAEESGMEWTLSTELPALVFDWERWEFVNEILLADGMMVPGIGQVPLLDSHNRNSAKDVLGHVRDFSASKVGGYAGRNGKIHFAADDDSQTIKQKVADGHITDGSVGYQVLSSIWVPEGTEVSIDGRLFTGPVRVSRTWSLKEFSITPIGADVLAKVRMLCGTTPRKN
ncbi:MAG TPA: hypothetical protein DDY20_05855 [Desulfobulbaceae bacterium]|jgi:hypothetical protein|nr:hypothetical protein [Desulfobulbaceae bacterium]